MRTLMISAAAVAFSAGIAFANSGTNQLASQAGVSANDYTQTQLIDLLQAQRDNDTARIRFIMTQAGQNATSGGEVVSNDAQLAAAAGVEPGLYTANELQRLISAKQNKNTKLKSFILSGENRVGGNEASLVTPGQEQIAALLGVDPSQYTLNELTMLYAQWRGDRS